MSMKSKKKRNGKSKKCELHVPRPQTLLSCDYITYINSCNTHTRNIVYPLLVLAPDGHVIEVERDHFAATAAVAAVVVTVVTAATAAAAAATAVPAG